MRLWTLHPRHLDARGLVALWREALLARAVLLGRTRGYRHHPQLDRFRAAPRPVAAINSYLAAVLEEARRRGYAFDASKVGRTRLTAPLPATTGQRDHEWQHLGAKLAVRCRATHARWLACDAPEVHPIFAMVPGEVESWERPVLSAGTDTTASRRDRRARDASPGTGRRRPR